MSGSKPKFKVRTLDEMSKKITESSGNDSEQLAQVKTVQYLAYPRLIADQLNLNQVRQEQPNRTWSLPFQPLILNTILNLHTDIAKLTVMDDTVKRKLLSSKWNDSRIFKFPSRYINKKNIFLFNFVLYYHI